MKPHSLLLMATLFAGHLATHCPAQPAYLLDPDFKPSSRRAVFVPSGHIPQTDGRFIGLGPSGLTRFGSDGTIDESFKPEVSGVWDDGRSSPIAIDGADKVLLFSLQTDGMAILIRLNPDGSLDRTFSAPNARFRPDTLPEIRPTPSGQILLTREIWDDTEETPGLAISRLNADGSFDSAFEVRSVAAGALLAVQADGLLLVARAGGLVRVQLDGAVDPRFVVPAEATNVFAALVQADGKIVIRGSFKQIGGRPSNGLARLFPNGALDSTFTPPAPTCELRQDGCSSCWLATAGQRPDGRLVVLWAESGQDCGAGFLHVFLSEPDGGVLRHTRTFIDSAISLPDWTSFPDLLSNGWVGGLAGSPILGFLPDGAFILQAYGSGGVDVVVPHIVVVTADGYIVAPGTVPTVRILGRQPDGNLLVEGKLQLDDPPEMVTRIGPDGTVIGRFPRPIGVVDSPTVLADGSLLIRKVSANGQLSIVRLKSDGALDAEFALTPLNPNHILGASYGVILLPHGERGTLVSESFYDRARGNNVHELWRIAPTGGRDPSFRAILTMSASSIPFPRGVTPDGRILVIQTGSRILSSLNPDGTVDAGFKPFVASNQISKETSLADAHALHNGRILVALTRRQVISQGATFQSTLVRLMADGTLDSTYHSPPQVGYFEVVAAGEDGSAIVRVLDPHEPGYFPPTKLARFAANGTEDLSFAALFPVPSEILSAKLETDGSLLVSGTYSAINRERRVGLARFKPTPVWRGSSFDAIGRFTGTIGCLPGWKYRVEASADLQQWDTVASGTSAGESVPFTDTAPPEVERRFYRVVRK